LGRVDKKVAYKPSIPVFNKKKPSLASDKLEDGQNKFQMDAKSAIESAFNSNSPSKVDRIKHTEN